jgi:cytochrome c-type biogenesis protein CcmH
MIGFGIGAACLLVVAAAFVAWPLLRHRDQRHRDQRHRDQRHRDDVREANRSAINVSLYRQRSAEIDADRRSGLLSDTEAESLRQELAGTLLDDDVAERNVGPSARPSASAAIVIVLAVVLGSVALYRALGAYDAVGLADAAMVLREPDAQPAALADLVKRLRSRVAAHPEDAESLYLLGHTLLRQDDAAGAVTVFEQLTAVAGNDAGALVALAQARFVAADGQITDANRELIQRILAIAPQESTVLEMLALEAFRNADYATAAKHLEGALAGGATGARAEALQQGLARTRALLGDTGGPALDVTVQLGDAARTLPDTAALFVFAKKPGQRMPLLVARRAAGDGATTVRLDKTNAMAGDVTLADGDVLEVGARLSKTGNIAADTADLQVSQQSVKLTGGVVPVTLVLAPAAAPAAATAMNSPPPNAATGTAAIAVDVALAPGVDAHPPARVFVIARAPNGPPMPIAVRALDPATLPQTLHLTDGDAMQSGRVLSMFDQVEVLARLSLSGNPMRQPGDLESPIRLLDPHGTGPIVLTIGAK